MTQPLSCPHCGTEMKQHEHCFSHPTARDCLLSNYSFDNEKVDSWNRRVGARRPVNVRTEERAREIYDSWSESPGWVPWVDGGNSLKQSEARAEAQDEIVWEMRTEKLSE